MPYPSQTVTSLAGTFIDQWPRMGVLTVCRQVTIVGFYIVSKYLRTLSNLSLAVPREGNPKLINDQIVRYSVDIEKLKPASERMISVLMASIM